VSYNCALDTDTALHKHRMRWTAGAYLVLRAGFSGVSERSGNVPGRSGVAIADNRSMRTQSYIRPIVVALAALVLPACSIRKDVGKPSLSQSWFALLISAQTR
jgi:hypothetical protein